MVSKPIVDTQTNDLIGSPTEFDSLLDENALLIPRHSEDDKKVTQAEVITTLADDDDLDDSEDMVWLTQHRHSLSSLNWWQRPSVLSISIVLGLFGLANAISAPSKLSLLYKLACNSVANSNRYCDPIDTQQLFTTFSLYSDVLGNVVSLVALSKVGELSDKYGRRLFFIISSISMLTSGLLTFYAVSYYDTMNLPMLLFATVVQSSCGGISAFAAFSSAYVSDVVEPSKRITSLGLVDSFVPIGLLLGTCLSKIYLSMYKPNPEMVTRTVVKPKLEYTAEFQPLLFELGLLTLLTLYCLVGLPESRNKNAMLKSRRYSMAANDSHSWKDILTKVSRVFKPLTLLTLPGPMIQYYKNHARIRPSFIVLVSICLLGTVLSVTISPILLQYGMLRYKWDAESISNMMLVITIATIFGTTVILPFLSSFLFKKVIQFRSLKKQLDLIDFCIILVGLIFNIIGFLCLSSDKLFIVGVIMVPWSNISQAPLVSSLLKFIPESKTGEFFAAKSLLQNICTIFAPILAQNLYRFLLVRGKESYIFEMYAGIVFASVAGLFIVKKLLRLTRRSTDETLDN